MGKYVTKRVLLAIVTVFIVCGITFFAMNAIPGGPFDGEKALSPEVKEALEKRFNLDKPVGEQFVLYMKNLALFDASVLFQDLHNGICGNTFSGTGLSYDSQDFASVQIKGNTVYRHNLSSVSMKRGI